MILTYEIWRELTPDVKAKMSRIFGVKRSNGSNQVETGLFNGQMRTVIRSDGYTNKDVEVITTEVLQGFLGSTEDDFTKLWQLTLDKITSPNFVENEERKKDRTEQGAVDRAGGEETSGREAESTGSSGEEAPTRPPKAVTRSDRQPGPKQD